ncbi:MAG: type VI secretion system lipoprotein TssJ [Desulfovibrio sp.]|jgi:type VI secretion system VasD/TssJ family lipoprotein|nr:type VI secretion system lipoprotein TssJ [Desulfovibrio sp.]
METRLSNRPLPFTARPRLWLLFLLILPLLFAALGCGSKNPDPKPQKESETPDNVLWTYASKALSFHFSAAKDLNAFDNKAHSLQLCIYQLDKREAFEALAGTDDGKNSLLQCAAFDKSVKASARVFVQPGEDAVHTLDRAEGTQFVGIAGGYFESTPQQSVKLWEIAPKSTVSGSLFWKSTTYSAGSLALSLHLSAHALEDMDDADKDKDPNRGKGTAPSPQLSAQAIGKTDDASRVAKREMKN